MVPRAAQARIGDELEAFLESGLAIVVATRDHDLQPDCAAAWAVRVHADRRHLTVFLFEAAAAEMLDNLQRFSEIAIDLDRPTTHRACQVKGHFVASRTARSSEREVVETQADAFAEDLATIGIPREMMAAWPRWPCAAVKVRVTEIYEQSPGPGAGELLS